MSSKNKKSSARALFVGHLGAVGVLPDVGFCGHVENLQKIVIVGERYDQHLDFGIDTIVEQTHGSRFWWTDRIGHVQSMILTQHVVFYFRHQELHDLVILFLFFFFRFQPLSYTVLGSIIGYPNE